MAKATEPLMSLTASGTLAKTLTYGRNRGIEVVRQRVVSHNLQTPNQKLSSVILAGAQ